MASAAASAAAPAAASASAAANTKPTEEATNYRKAACRLMGVQAATIGTAVALRQGLALGSLPAAIIAGSLAGLNISLCPLPQNVQNWHNHFIANSTLRTVFSSVWKIASMITTVVLTGKLHDLIASKVPSIGTSFFSAVAARSTHKVAQLVIKAMPMIAAGYATLSAILFVARKLDAKLPENAAATKVVNMGVTFPHIPNIQPVYELVEALKASGADAVSCMCNIEIDGKDYGVAIVPKTLNNEDDEPCKVVVLNAAGKEIGSEAVNHTFFLVTPVDAEGVDSAVIEGIYGLLNTVTNGQFGVANDDTVSVCKAATLGGDESVVPAAVARGDKIVDEAPAASATSATSASSASSATSATPAAAAAASAPDAKHN
ncbi:MAG: hypothetical protein P0S95_04045 [Rhabdochlamydiaceae bacterium]|nr:hypothetical protein [Candidatus Amphrikana amoebophyrae]